MRFLFYFILMMGLSAPCAPQAFAKRIGLVIGNDTYSNLPPHYQLQKAQNDARATAETFSKLGFDILKGFDLNRRAMNIKLSTLANKIEPGDEVLFFFAGHGVRIGGLNYLLPSDIPSIGSADENLLKAESLRVDEITDLLRQRGARLSILVLDACRNNPFQDNKGRSIGGRRGLAAMDPPEGTLILFSAGAGQAALDRLEENDPNPNSVFTRTFLPLVQQEGLELARLSRQVKAKVRNLAKSINHTQTPAIYNEVIGDVYLSGAPKTSNKTPIVTQNKRADEILWETIKNSTNKSDFEFFLKEHPGSPYASLAKLKSGTFKQQKLALQTAPKPDKRQDTGERDYKKAKDYFFGQNGTQKDLTQAFEWAQKAAHKDLTIAMSFLAKLYNTGQGTPKDHTQAFKWYQKTAQKGHTDDMIELATLYYEGLGVEKDFSQAFHWFKKAADQGNTDGMIHLALLYDAGEGVTTDKSQVVKLVKKAANKGNIQGMYILAGLYEEGHGVPQDTQLAFKWYLKAANKGNIPAMLSLALIYDSNIAVFKNPPQGALWMSKAIKAKNDFALIEMTTHLKKRSKEFRREFQKIMHAEGVYTGKIDGNFDASTIDAIKQLAGQ